MDDATSPPVSVVRRRMVRGRCVVRFVLALLAGWLAFVAWREALPRLVRLALQRTWERVCAAPLRFCVRETRWGRVVLTDLTIGDPGDPEARVARAEATFSLTDLSRGALDTVWLAGVRLRGSGNDGAWWTDWRGERPDATPSGRRSRLPFRALHITESSLRWEAAGAPATQRAAFFDVHLLPEADGRARRLDGRVALVRGADTVTLSLAATGTDPLEAAGAAVLNVTGAMKPRSVAASVHVDWQRREDGGFAVAFSNGVVWLSHEVARAWRPASPLGWDGAGISLHALAGRLAWPPAGGDGAAVSAWEGALEGRFGSARHRLVAWKRDAPALELTSIEGRFRAARGADGRLTATWDAEAPWDLTWRGDRILEGWATVRAAHGFAPDAQAPDQQMSATLRMRPAGGLSRVVSFLEEARLTLESAVAPPPWPAGVTYTLEAPRVAIGGGGGADSNRLTVSAARLEGNLRFAPGLTLERATGELSMNAEATLPGVAPIAAHSVNAQVAWDREAGWGATVRRFAPAPFTVGGLEGVHVSGTQVLTSNGVPVAVAMDVGAARSAGRARLTVRPVATSGGWELLADVPAFDLAGDDALQGVLRRYLPFLGAEVTGRMDGAAALQRGLDGGWGVQARLRLADARAGADGWRVEGLNAEAHLRRWRGRWRTESEQHLTFRRAWVGGVPFDGGRVTWQLDGESLRVPSAELDWLGGHLRAYALHLDTRQQAAAFVLYVDRIAVDRLLRLVRPLAGSGEGRLFGRIPVRFERGRWIPGTAYLYAMPGQEGAIRLDDTRALVALLARAGVPREMRDTLAAALRDFGFSAFSMELHPPGEDGEALLSVRLLGASRDSRRPTPVNATLNLRGPLETLLNMGVALGREME